MEMPRICVCTAPDAAVVQTSLLIDVIAGATAVGGGDITLVVASLVLRDVESVTIGCDKIDVQTMPNASMVKIFVFILPWSLLF